MVEENERLILSIVSDNASGENRRDLHQEILLRIWKSLTVFKGQASSSTWVYRVALNTALDFQFRQKRNVDIQLDKVADATLQSKQTPMQGNYIQLLREFMKSLNGAEREIFEMYLNDLSYKEISEITGLGENCLRMRISRIKRKFEERYIES